MSKNISWKALVPALAVSVALAATSVHAQDPVKWSAKVTAESAAPGGKLKVAVKAVIDPGWYIYSITQGEGGPVPSRITLGADQPFTLAGEVTGTKPRAKFDENFSMQVEVHEGSVEYEVPVTGPLVNDPLAAEGSIEWHQRGCCQPLSRSMHRVLQTILGIIASRHRRRQVNETEYRSIGDGVTLCSWVLFTMRPTCGTPWSAFRNRGPS